MVQASVKHIPHPAHFRSYSSAAQAAARSLNWHEQLADLQKMWQDDVPLEEIAAHLQRSASAVLTQAVRQGLPRRALPGRKPLKSATPPRLKCLAPPNVIQFRNSATRAPGKTAPSAQQTRNCLMCSTTFPSAGAHNRICAKCKDGQAYQTGSLYSEYEIFSASA